MKTTLPFFLTLSLLFLVWNIQAQDLIVTAKGDSINASVIKIKDDYIHFVFDHQGEIRRTLLPLNEVKYHQNYFGTAAVPAESLPDLIAFSRYRIGLSGGLSYMIAPVSEQVMPFMRDYIKDLKSGTHYGGDFDFFFSELIGVGFRYRSFNTRNELKNVMFYELGNSNQNYQVGTIKDNIRVQYFGPAMVIRTASKSGNMHFSTGFSISYVDFLNRAVYLDRYTIRSETIGFGMEVGLDFKLDKNLAMGFGLSYTGISFSSVEYDYGGVKETIKLSGES